MSCALRTPVAAVALAWVMQGCATAQAPGEAASVAEKPVPRADKMDEAPDLGRLQIPATHLEGGRGLRRLCESFRDSANMTFKGNAVEQARQREQHAQQRATAIDGRYDIVIPPAGFAFDGYDLTEGKLRLADQRFSVEEGLEIDRPSSDDAIGFVLSEPAAERLLQLQLEGKLSLRVVFQAQTSQMRPELCIRQSGGHMIKLGAQVLAVYVLGPVSAPLARYQTEAFAQMMAELTPVKSPKVTLGKPVSSDATAVSAAAEASLAKLEGPLLACYQDALTRRATTSGTLIVGMTLGKDGRAQQARMEMSTIADERLIACVIERVSKTTVPASPPLPAALSLPMDFGDSDP